MFLTLAIWVILSFIFVGFPFTYYLYMKKRAVKPWKLEMDETYKPPVNILVPMHNEEKTIRFKLENLYKLNYPADKVQVILVDDASTDRTWEEAHAFVNSHKGLNTKILENRTEQTGKSNALNFALKHMNSDIIVVSDADCFWHADTLMKVLPYLSDPSVGAVTAREILLNPEGSWVTKSELFYNNIVQTIRVGESKTHSTIFFQGGFAVYKKAFLDEFDRETDDSGTALNIVQRKGRTLIIPEANFYTMFPTNWKNKLVLKIRRANQLQQLWSKCLKLLLHGRLALPKRIAVPEIFLHIFNPLLFMALIFATAFIIFEQALFLPVFLLCLLPILCVSKTRTPLVEAVQNNLILIAAMITLLRSKSFRNWRPVQESRLLLDEDVLRERQLI